ncbi:unnamed protein product [Didymodactylos carnosus]|uniref:Uncharacterized protein n=1 Tax=Didymodactylos carnosus TaxID=1234261 RepID=A0A8S2KN57_9BILA|nr:unnamed protein product [Didymodactylos carnosus]CAF3861816.1 unnamed protein product [Didymodactylos carnosus]
MPPIQRLAYVFEDQYRNDPEKSFHTTALYAMWAAKSFMLNYTANWNPFESDYFLWIDGGSFRESTYRFTKWPDAQRIKTIFARDPDRLLLSLVHPLKKRFCSFNYSLEDGPVKFDLFEGGIIAGSFQTIIWWTKVYFNTIDLFVDKSYFVGKDQHIMNAIALAHSTRILVILSFRLKCGNEWFVYGPLLADQNEKKSLFRLDCHSEGLMNVIQKLDKICLEEINIS